MKQRATQVLPGPRVRSAMDRQAPSVFGWTVVSAALVGALVAASYPIATAGSLVLVVGALAMVRAQRNRRGRRDSEDRV